MFWSPKFTLNFVHVPQNSTVQTPNKGLSNKRKLHIWPRNLKWHVMDFWNFLISNFFLLVVEATKSLVCITFADYSGHNKTQKYTFLQIFNKKSLIWWSEKLVNFEEKADIRPTSSKFQKFLILLCTLWHLVEYLELSKTPDLSFILVPLEPVWKT